MENINALGKKLLKIESELKILNEKTLAVMKDDKILQEKAINLDNHIQDLIRDYRDALDEEKQLDSELSLMKVDRKAEEDLHSFTEKLRGLGWSVLPSTTKDEPSLYKFDFIQGYSLTIQIQDNRLKLIDMQPIENFENIKNELDTTQDLMGLLIAIKEFATIKAGVKCS